MSTADPEYDFVVIGGGTAGLVVANRLTEDANTSVLVLEAGSLKLDDPRVTTPGLSVALTDNDEFDWKFRSVPQAHLDGKEITYPRGKTVGGSSAINILGLVYPSKTNIDSWEKLGNKDWTWDRLEPYYRKFHTYNPPGPDSTLGVNYIDTALQGSTGPIQSSYPSFVNPLVQAWPPTFEALGWGITGDPLSGRSLGGFNGPYTVNQNGVVRSHAGNEYYAPVAHRPNLHLETGAHVTKLEFQHEEGALEAQVVHYRRQGTIHSVRARKEVILAAGTFQTPQLLELSGIGARSLLEKYGIPVLLDQPNVGENLQDHAMTGICAEVVDSIPTGDKRRDPEFFKVAQELYAQKRTGPLTAGFPSFAFLPLKGWADDAGLQEAVDSGLQSATVPDSRPSWHAQAQCVRDILLAPDEASAQLILGTSQVHFDKSSYKDVFAVTEPENFVAIMVALPHPLSAGGCHIASADPQAAPTIDPRFMSHPLDAEVMGRHLTAIDKVLAAPPFAHLIKPGGRRLPAASPLFAHHDSAEQRREAGRTHARRYIRSTSHPTGTCAMLPRAEGGVVDARLRPYGTSHLRIVDASIFPMVPRGNIQSTVYAVAERAADLIKEDWGIAPAQV